MPRQPRKIRRQYDPDKLPGNPHEDRAELEPVARAKGVARRSRSGLAYRIRSIGNGLFDEIVIPALKSTLLDFLNSGASMMIFGEDARRGQQGRRGHTSYHQPYSGRARGRREASRRRIVRARPTEEVFLDIFYDTREEAGRVLGRLLEQINDYGAATVGDYNALSGRESNYTQQRWGWDDLSGCRPYYTADGWLIDLPDIIDLD